MMRVLAGHGTVGVSREAKGDTLSWTSGVDSRMTGGVGDDGLYGATWGSKRSLGDVEADRDKSS